MGLLLHFSTLVPMNTDLYSISYVLVSGGAGGLLLCFCYWVVDMKKTAAFLWRPFMWLGMNAIVMYLCAEGDIIDWFIAWFYVDGDPDKNLANILWPTGVYWGDKGDDLDRPEEPTHNVAVLFWIFGYIGIWMLVAREMHMRKIYIRL